MQYKTSLDEEMNLFQKNTIIHKKKMTKDHVEQISKLHL